MDVKTVLALMVRHGLTTAAGILVTHGYMASSGTEQFVSAGLFLAAIVWSWWQKSGQAQITALLKKLTGHQTVPGAVAEAKLIPAAPVVTPLQEAQTIATAAKIGAALLLGLLLFAPHSAFAQQRAVSALVPVDIRAIIVADLTAARDDAKQFSDPSELCWATLLGHANSMPVKLAGAAHTVQRLRDLRRGIPQLLDACAVVKDGARQALLQIFGSAVTGVASLTALGF